MPRNKTQTSGLFSLFLQRMRFKKALDHVRPVILDIGCHKGELAAYFDCEEYVGIDIDGRALEMAKRCFPRHKFHSWPIPGELGRFETIVMLAVVEHVKDPSVFLSTVAGFLKDTGCIVMTTPHPSFDTLYRWGAQLGLFSREALEEHQGTYDLAGMESICQKSKLRIVQYQRFLLGANQLFILQKENSV